MNRTAAQSNATNDLIAAMPIVILFNALRAAFQRPATVRSVLRTSEAR